MPQRPFPELAHEGSLGEQAHKEKNPQEDLDWE